jgi:uncharacterized RDD family membrane protein YckC
MTCRACGREFAPADLAVFGEHSVCAECQPGWVQQYRQGMLSVAAPAEVRYAGFWIRAAALLIDSLILGTFQFVVEFVVGYVLSRAGVSPIPEAIEMDLQVMSLLVQIFYFCWFRTHSGATPGKMVFGLKVIDHGGGPVRLGQAVKRWFAQILSGVLLGYGYMKAGWSPEKMSMHDGIARTRVIYAR